MKNNIDRILEEQLFKANRSYSEKNKLVKELMNVELKKSSIDFLKELDYRWNWHNSFYEELLEPSYFELMNSSLEELTPKQVQEFIEIYKTCLLVDEVTLVSSAAIKKHLEYQLPKMNLDSEGLSFEEEHYLMLTPPIETFFNQYQIDHLTYLKMIKENNKNAKEYKEILLNKYHANDEKIFESRLNRDFNNVKSLDVNSLQQEIDNYKLRDEFKIKSFYYTLEHPDRKAYRDILVYDNITEKFIGFTLIGISGFLFRKNILSYLNDSKILPNEGYIYEFADEKVLESLEKLKKITDKKMCKNVNTYRQTDDTCAIVCMMSILEYYDKIKDMNRKQEIDFYKQLKSEVLIGTPFSSIAEYLVNNDFDIEIIHSDNNLFHNNNYLTEEVFNLGLNEYKLYLDKAINNGAKLTTGCELAPDLIRHKLKENKFVMLAGNHGIYLHSILVCGYENESFIVFDPSTGQKEFKTPNEIFKYLRTPIGEWGLAINHKEPNKDRMISKLDEFNSIAEKKLKLVNK